MSAIDKQRTKELVFNTILLSLAMFFGLVASPAFAAEVENVQIGTTTISGTSQSIAITPVTDDKSILIFTLTTQSTASGPQDTHLRGQLSCIAGSCDSIDFKRYGSGDSVIIRWQVIEFTDASAVSVQRGIVTQSSMAGSPPSRTISTGVDSAKSFVMLSEFVHGTVTSNDDFTRGQINSSGNLVITVGEKKTLATQAEIAWQVIEYQDANIQTGDSSFSTSDASKTITISTVDLNKSLLVYNYYSTGTSSDNPVCQNLVSGLISDATTLQFDRGCAGHNGQIHLSWFAIEFTDASTVQHKKQTFTSTELSKTVTLTNVVDTSCAVITTSGNQRGGQSPATVDHTSSAWFNANINTAGDEITLTRGQTNGVNAETAWSVVEFEGCGSSTAPPVTPSDLSCSLGYQLETWPASAPASTVFNSSNNFLNLTASKNFTNSTHPGIGGIRTSSSYGEVSETLTISSIDPSVSDIEKFRVLVYDLDSETSSDQDYAYITFNSINVGANSMGSNVEPHPTIPNAYTAILNSGGGSGADDPYHAGFVVDGVTDGSTITMTSGYTGTGSESFVGYQACIQTILPPTDKCFAMADNKAELYSFDLDISTAPKVVATGMILNGEGATYRATDNAIYAFHQPVEGTSEPSDLYRVELDGTTTLIKSNFITEQGVGAEFVRYTDGSEHLIVLLRQWDSRIEIFDAMDLNSATPLSTLPLTFPDGSNARVDSLAINPATGETLVVDDADDEFDFPEIYSVNMTTGELTLKVVLSVPGIDAESLAFAEDGSLYLENEGWVTPPEYDHRIFRVNLATGGLTAVEENINSLITGDIEGMSCTGSKIITPNGGSTISGTVFNDVNGNDVFDTGEPLLGNMSVWLQLVNADGSINPFKLDATTNAVGVYQIGGLADGNYQLTVDDNDADLPDAHVVGGTNPLFITINGANISNADFPFDEMVCTAFTGEVNEVALPISSQLNATEKLFVPSTSISSAAGHLRAYPIDNSGVPSSTPDWDVASSSLMTGRATKLFSTDGSGGLVLFDSLAAPAAAIRTYTINSVLGGVSKGNSLDILSNKINVSLYLADTVYRTYYSGTVAARSKRVLMSSDDGFLYAFDYTTGELVWGWMPNSLTTELTGDDTYQAQHLMAGSVDILDLKDSAGTYATYIVGSYKSGLGHYVLKLDDDGDLVSVVWDDDQSGSFTKSPNNGEMEFFKDNDKTYAAYVLANEVAVSRLKIKSLVDTSPAMNVDLTYQASSTPFVMPDYGKSNAPANKTLYLGSTNGDIYSTTVVASGSLKTESAIQTGLDTASVTDVGASEPVLYIDSSVSAKDSLYYLSTQTATRLTLHRYNYNATGTSTWNKDWTSYSSGAGSWDDSGTSYTADTSGVPGANTDGFNIIPPTGIQSLPVDATITAKAVIVGDSVVLPLSVLPTGSACYGKAYYYLYSLSDGTFPSKTFFNNDGTQIVTDIALGYGEAKQLTITDMAGTNKLLGYGMADKKTDLSSGIATSFVIKDPVAVGIRAWKEIGR